MFKKITFIALLLFVSPLTFAALAEHQISLKNGNVAKGEIQGNVLKFNTELGVLEAPVDEIKSISVNVVKTKGGSSLLEIAMEMQDGAILKGNFIEKTLAVKTRYGVLNVKLEDIKEVSKVEEPVQPARAASVPVRKEPMVVQAAPVAVPKNPKETPVPQAQEAMGLQSNQRSDVSVEPGRPLRDDLSMQGRMGAGVQLSAINLELGPTGEYWITENIGVSASIGLFGDFTSYGIRGNYLFNNRLNIYGIPSRPYVGLGYASIEGPEQSYGDITLKTEGSGFELYAGLIQPAFYIYPNVYIKPEFVYSAVKVEATGEYELYGETYSVSADADYSSFGFGVALVYYFK